MSAKLKNTLAIWITFVAGTVVLFLQIRAYYMDNIELNVKELAVTAVALVIMFRPNILVNAFRSRVSSQDNADEDDK